MGKLNIRELNKRYSSIPQLRHHETPFGHGKMMHTEKSYYKIKGKENNFNL